jgi:hypothetical protein
MLQRRYHVYKLKQIYPFSLSYLFTSDGQKEACSISVGKLVEMHLPLGRVVARQALPLVLLAS